MWTAFEADAGLCQNTDSAGRIVNLPSKHRIGLWLNRIDQRSANYGSTYHESKRRTVFEHHGESKRVTNIDPCSIRTRKSRHTHSNVESWKANTRWWNRSK